MKYHEKKKKNEKSGVITGTVARPVSWRHMFGILDILIANFQVDIFLIYIFMFICVCVRASVCESKQSSFNTCADLEVSL
jgi:hypothetical protein